MFLLYKQVRIETEAVPIFHSVVAFFGLKDFVASEWVITNHLYHNLIVLSKREKPEKLLYSNLSAAWFRD